MAQYMRIDVANLPVFDVSTDDEMKQIRNLCMAAEMLGLHKARDFLYDKYCEKCKEVE